VEGEVYRKRKTAPNLGEELAAEGVGACAEKPQPAGATLVEGEACGKEGGSGLEKEGERLAAP
jgi:hypothetical protein